MSKYNIYARKLDTAYKNALGEYTAAYQKMGQDKQRAAQAMDAARQHNNMAGVMRAKADDMEAEAAFKEASKRIWGDFNQQRASIKKELEAEVRADSTASPDAVDPNGLEILKSGIMTPDEYAAFAEKYDTNPTMLRFIAKYAKEAAATMKDDPGGRGVLNGVVMACQDGRSATLRAWDGISTIANYCSGQSREGRTDRPEHILSMGSRWEELSAQAIENF